MMTFMGEDNGFCRVYFRRTDGDVILLYCWQLDGPGVFKFLRCSRDGEPDYEVRGWGGVPAAQLTPAFKPETSTGRDLVAFLETQRSN